MSSRYFSGHRLWRLMCGTRKDAPTDYHYICSQGSKQKSMSNPGPPTSRITTREVPHPQNYDQALHKQNYDHGANIPNKQNYDQGAC